MTWSVALVVLVVALPPSLALPHEEVQEGMGAQVYAGVQVGEGESVCLHRPCEHGVCQEDLGMVWCQEDLGMVWCQEDLGVVWCMEDLGMVWCQVNLGMVWCQEDLGRVPGAKSQSLANREEILNTRRQSTLVGVGYLSCHPSRPLQQNRSSSNLTA